MNAHRTTARTLFVGIAATLLLAACGSGGADTAATPANPPGTVGISTPEWDAVVAAAEEEGTVTMYSVALPAISERLEAAFEKAYPDIDLQITRLLSAEIDGKLDAERDTGSGGADIVSHVNYAWMDAAQHADRLVEPVGPDATGPEWKGTPYLRDGALQMTVLPAIGIAWNTSIVDKPLDGFDDFLDPSLAGGAIGIVDPAAPAVGDFYAFLEDEQGPEFLGQLAAQQPKKYPSAVPLEQALAAGEVGVAIYSSGVGISDAKSKGAPVEFHLPTPSWSPTNITYILANATHPNAAQVLFNFMATREGQSAIAIGNVSPLVDIEGTAGNASSVTAINIERVLSPDFTKSYYDTWLATFGG
jgi:iron(III) transport system substrate-binding protein